MAAVTCPSCGGATWLIEETIPVTRRFDTESGRIDLDPSHQFESDADIYDILCADCDFMAEGALYERLVERYQEEQ